MTESTQHVLEHSGRAFEKDGMPRIAGKVIGAILLSPEPLSLDELAARLQVSKASASTNTRLLERLGVVERTTRPGDRRDYYALAPDFHVRLLAVALEPLRHGEALLECALRSGGAVDPAVRERVERCRGRFARVLAAADAVSKEVRPGDADGGHTALEAAA